MLAPVLLLFALALPPQSGEVVAELRVHGNSATADEEILRLAEIQVGAPFEDGTIAAVEARLRAAGKFRDVDVLKRFASIADPSKVIVVIIVDDGPVKIEWDPESGAPPRTVRRRGPQVMFLPVLDAEDGYGLTYGVRFALPDIAGARSRLAFPLTWGGDKRAAVQLEKALTRGPLHRFTAGASISRRENPHFERNDDRLRGWVRAERDVTARLRVGLSTGSARVSFMDGKGRFVQVGADVVLDTRIDPMLARNAVYVRASWDRFAFRDEGAINRRAIDARGYVGLTGQSVLVVRGYRDSSNRAQPSFLQPLLGGMENLRGFKAGSAVGDSLAAGSLELRVPITSPLSVGKIGLSAFVDAGTVDDHGERLANQRFDKGVGGGVWVSAAFLRLNLAVAHGIGGSTRAHFGTSLTF